VRLFEGVACAGKLDDVLPFNYTMSQSFRTEVLDQLREMDSDITRPHNFDFYIYVPTELAARQVADKARESEFAAEVLPETPGGSWLCRASITIVPEIAPLDDIGSFFSQVAAALHGEFDGWEADVIEK
jgi:hypothetical protein